MAKRTISNQTTSVKRRVRLCGRALAKSRSVGTLTVTPTSERAAACHVGACQTPAAKEEPVSQRQRLSIRGPDPRAESSATFTAFRNRLRACPPDNSGCKHRVITLTQGKFAIVDAEDYERLSKHKWCASKSKGRFYAQRTEKGKTIKMHREIMNPPPGMVCDHKNHNTLDNRRSNLRICTAAQNTYNMLPQSGGTSRYKGVVWCEDHHKWQASIRHNRRLIHIGYYDYEADAAIAYDDNAVELFGEFACLNFNHSPEIRLWMEATYLFCPTKNDLATVEAG